jgi:hypothetical protein
MKDKQPQFDKDSVSQLTNIELADLLDNWAKNRDRLSDIRVRLSKLPLDSNLLKEAAIRLRYHGVKVNDNQQR